jgi:hypothetical protein
MEQLGRTGVSRANCYQMNSDLRSIYKGYAPEMLSNHPSN